MVFGIAFTCWFPSSYTLLESKMVGSKIQDMPFEPTVMDVCDVIQSGRGRSNECNFFVS